MEHPNELRAKASPGEVQVNAQGETIEMGPSFDAVLEDVHAGVLSRCAHRGASAPVTLTTCVPPQRVDSRVDA